MYIVTGGAGFIGSAMVWHLNKQGVDEIMVVDNLASTEKWKNLVNCRYHTYMHRDDFMNTLKSNQLPDRITAIIHMGACSSTTEKDADFLMRNNLQYSQNLCRYALERGIRFINASSAATYGDGSTGFSDGLLTMFKLRPLNMYGYSKHLFDLWAQRKNILSKIASLKFFNVYGANEYHKGEMRSMVCKAVEQIKKNGSLRLFKSDQPNYAHGGQMRDFVYIKDCVQIIWHLLNNHNITGTLNIGSGSARTWNDLAKAVFKAMNLTPNIEYVDMPEILKGKYQYFTQAEMDWMARYDYDFSFHSLEAGITDYVSNYLLKENSYLE